LNSDEEKRMQFIFDYLAGQELNENELELLTSFEEQMKKDGCLSERQMKIAETIYRRYP